MLYVRGERTCAVFNPHLVVGVESSERLFNMLKVTQQSQSRVSIPRSPKSHSCAVPLTQDLQPWLQHSSLTCTVLHC